MEGEQVQAGVLCLVAEVAEGGPAAVVECGRGQEQAPRAMMHFEFGLGTTVDSFAHGLDLEIHLVAGSAEDVSLVGFFAAEGHLDHASAGGEGCVVCGENFGEDL